MQIIIYFVIAKRDYFMHYLLLQASDRIARNLQQVNSSKQLDIFSKISKISKNVCDVGGCVQSNPLGF